MMNKYKRSEAKACRGDTIIEVVFAFAIFSLITVGAYSIMNQGTAIAQRSLEITQVREQINAQAETLRYLHDAYVESDRNTTIEPRADGSLAQKWQYIANYTTTSPQANSECQFENISFNNAFVVDPQTLTVVTSRPIMPRTYAKINGKSSPEGIWVQAVKGDNKGGVGFLDFHIYACWQSVGQSMPVTLGTIVRLYEPTN